MSFIDKLFGKKPGPVVEEPEVDEAAKPKRKKRAPKEEAALTPAQKRAQTLAKKKMAAAEAEVKKAERSNLVDGSNLTKEEATARGEPWVTVVAIDLDPDNMGNGAFELDFNEVFVARLVKQGYVGKTDYDIVDLWFTSVCKHVIEENYEQEQADPEVRAATKRKELSGGRGEYS